MECRRLAEYIRDRVGQRSFPALQLVGAEQRSPALDSSNPFEPLVEVAALELAPEPLHVQIVQVAQRAIARGDEALQILPLFLLPGVHVMDDIPAEVELARQMLGDRLGNELSDRFWLNLRPHLGSHPNLANLLTAPGTIASGTTHILLAHGSRRPGGNDPVEAIASRLGAVSAYWGVAPHLEDRVVSLVDAGVESIAILPYFLFAGGLTDAIAQQVNQFSQRFPHVRFEQSAPLGASEELARLAIELLA